MAKLRIDVREIDRMAAEVVNHREIDAARQKRREEMKKDPEKIVGEFASTPAKAEFNWSAADAYQREGGSSRDIVDVIMQDKKLLGQVAPEFTPDEIEINVLPKEKRLEL